MCFGSFLKDRFIQLLNGGLYICPNSVILKYSYLDNLDAVTSSFCLVFQFESPSLADPNDEVKDPILEQEEDLGPVDEHKNVIMHLLSQLKLGMDLTKAFDCYIFLVLLLCYVLVCICSVLSMLKTFECRNQEQMLQNILRFDKCIEWQTPLD